MNSIIAKHFEINIRSLETCFGCSNIGTQITILTTGQRYCLNCAAPEGPDCPVGQAIIAFHRDRAAASAQREIAKTVENLKCLLANGESPKYFIGGVMFAKATYEHDPQVLGNCMVCRGAKGLGTDIVLHPFGYYGRHQLCLDCAKYGQNFVEFSEGVAAANWERSLKAVPTAPAEKYTAEVDAWFRLAVPLDNFYVDSDGSEDEDTATTEWDFEKLASENLIETEDGNTWNLEKLKVEPTLKADVTVRQEEPREWSFEKFTTFNISRADVGMLNEKFTKLYEEKKASLKALQKAEHDALMQEWD